MRGPYLSMLCVILLAGGFRAAADGPHWQVPNPEYSPEDKDNEKPRTREIVVGGRRIVVPLRSSGADYKSNPGDFLGMDDACIKYYEQHCALSYADGREGFGFRLDPAKAGKKRTEEEARREFYLLIMQRCAQAMREVDRYLPCPDSSPLWHEEDLREEMIKYAQRTWVLSMKLPPAEAAACAEICAKAFTDTVRFWGDLRNPAAPRWLADMAKDNQEIAKLLEQMESEKDTAKAQELRAKWARASNAAFRSATTDLRKEYTTFRLVTGDIPICVSDAEMRMMEALVGMGPCVIPFLTRDPALKNPRVQRAVQALIETVKRRWNLNRDGISTNPTAQNVADLLRQIAAKPFAAESQAIRRALESMGPKAWDHLVRLAEAEPPNVQKEALSLLRAFTKKPTPATLEEIKPVVAELLAAEKAKEKPPEPPPTIGLGPTPAQKEGEKKADEKKADEKKAVDPMDERE
jgi:uncharacterized protein YukE